MRLKFPGVHDCLFFYKKKAHVLYLIWNIPDVVTGFLIILEVLLGEQWSSWEHKKLCPSSVLMQYFQLMAKDRDAKYHRLTGLESVWPFFSWFVLSIHTCCWVSPSPSAACYYYWTMLLFKTASFQDGKTWCITIFKNTHNSHKTAASIWNLLSCRPKSADINTRVKFYLLSELDHCYGNLAKVTQTHRFCVSVSIVMWQSTPAGDIWILQETKTQ